MKLFEVEDLINLTIALLNFDFAPARKRNKLAICFEKKDRIAAGRQNMRGNSTADIYSLNITISANTHEELLY